MHGNSFERRLAILKGKKQNLEVSVVSYFAILVLCLWMGASPGSESSSKMLK
jgi:hypothetical protein